MSTLYRFSSRTAMLLVLVVIELGQLSLGAPRPLPVQEGTLVGPHEQLVPPERAVAGGGGSIYDAVTVSNVMVGGIPIRSRRRFAASDDWLKEMSIIVTNRTSMTIVYLSLILGFPEAGNGITEGYAEYIVELGAIPDVDAATLYNHPIVAAVRQKPLSLRPGESLEIRVGDYIDEIRSVVEKKMPLGMITKCAITLQTAFFEDGMVWNVTGFGLPDPESSRRVKYFDSHYFPGDRTQNWPPSH